MPIPMRFRALADTKDEQGRALQEFSNYRGTLDAWAKATADKHNCIVRIYETSEICVSVVMPAPVGKEMM
jgi:hypothetical protein